MTLGLAASFRLTFSRTLIPSYYHLVLWSSLASSHVNAIDTIVPITSCCLACVHMLFLLSMPRHKYMKVSCFYMIGVYMPCIATCSVTCQFQCQSLHTSNTLKHMTTCLKTCTPQCSLSFQFAGYCSQFPV